MSLEDLKNINKDDVLSAMGLQRQSSFTDTILPALAIFGAGLITGLGVGMLIAPNSGEESRRKIADKVDDAQQAGEEMVDKARKQVRAS